MVHDFNHPDHDFGDLLESLLSGFFSISPDRCIRKQKQLLPRRVKRSPCDSLTSTNNLFSYDNIQGKTLLINLCLRYPGS